MNCCENYTGYLIENNIKYCSNCGMALTNKSVKKSIIKHCLTLIFLIFSLTSFAQKNKFQVKIKKDYTVKVYVNHKLIKQYPKNLIHNRKLTIVKRNGYRLEIKPIKKTKVFQIHYLNEFEVFKEDLIIESKENQSL